MPVPGRKLGEGWAAWARAASRASEGALNFRETRARRSCDACKDRVYDRHSSLAGTEIRGGKYWWSDRTEEFGLRAPRSSEVAQLQRPASAAWRWQRLSRSAVPPSAACLLESTMRSACSSRQTSSRGKCLAMRRTGRGEEVADRVCERSVLEEAGWAKGPSGRWLSAPRPERLGNQENWAEVISQEGHLLSRKK